MWAVGGSNEKTNTTDKKEIESYVYQRDEHRFQ